MFDSFFTVELDDCEFLKGSAFIEKDVLFPNSDSISPNDEGAQIMTHDLVRIKVRKSVGGNMYEFYSELYAADYVDSLRIKIGFFKKIKVAYYSLNPNYYSFYEDPN